MKTNNILYIKNMVCPRCIKVVREELEKLDVEILSITLGEVTTLKDKKSLPLKEISKVLSANEFDLMEDEESQIIEKIKTEIISIIQSYKSIDLDKIVYSKQLTKIISKEYNYLSSLFSKTEGITIEQFIILQRIEKVKELLKYNELTLSEISYTLGYSSVQHLSKQFKNVTGFTASQYKTNINSRRKSIDSI